MHDEDSKNAVYPLSNGSYLELDPVAGELVAHGPLPWIVIQPAFIAITSEDALKISETGQVLAQAGADLHRVLELKAAAKDAVR